jgi:outer membrane protein assembly factor BamB
MAMLQAFMARAENWPEFRGPTRQGLSSEKDLPLTWSATDNVLWKTTVPGVSWSTPIVWDNRVFLTTATEEGQSCRIVAIDAQTGTTVWNKEVIRQVPRKKETRNSYAHTSYRW